MGRKNRRASAAKAPAATKRTGDNGQRLIDLALDKLNRGHDKEAANLLKRAIKSNPQDPTAQLLMGLALCRQSKPHEALAFLHRAAGLAPDEPEVHFHLANAHVLCGEGDAAANAYARALALKPDFADAYRELALLMISSGLKEQAGECLGLAVQYNPQDALACFNLAILEKERGNPQGALELYARAASIDPTLKGAHVNMGNIALDFGKAEQAEKCYRKAIEIDPGFAIAYANLGRALRSKDDFEGSEEVCRKAIALDPNLPDGHNNLANAIKEQGRVDEALKSYEQALALNPDDGVVWYNYGDALHQLFRYPEAAEAYQKALALRPNLAVACNNYGLVLTEMGRRGEAVEMFTRAVELAPEHSGYKCSLSQSLLSIGRKKLADMGRLTEAYELADHCFVCGLRQPNRQFGKIPRWRGEDLSGKRLLIWREQGVGDEIRLSQRYPQAIEAAGHCIIEAEERLIGLMRRSYPAAEFLPVDPENDEAREDADFHVPAGGLEEFFEKGFVEYSGGGNVLPYIATEPDRQTVWKERLDALGSGLKIGICWRSSLSGRLRDPFYCELSDWADLLQLDGVQFVNLQYDDCEEELRQAETAFGVTIHRWEGVDLKDDLEEVFALTSELDLVITAGTAVAEIAIARAVPVWCYLVGSASPGYKPRPMRDALAVNWLRHIGETWVDILGRMASYLEEQVINQNEPAEKKSSLQEALMLGSQPFCHMVPAVNRVPSADLCDLIPELDAGQELLLPSASVAANTAKISITSAYEGMALAAITRHLSPNLVVDFGTRQGSSAYIFAANGPSHRPGIYD